MASPGETRENTAAVSSGQPLSQDTYVHRVMGSPNKKDLQPFLVEIVDENGTLTRLPFPPEFGNTSTRSVLGVKFMISPSSLSVNMSKLINRTQTMVGWIEEHWGEEIDTITFQGTTAAFVIGAPSLRSLTDANHAPVGAQRLEYYKSLGLDDLAVPQGSASADNGYNAALMNAEPGLTTRYRRSSLSYQQLKKLVEIFATNGCVFDSMGFVKVRKFIRLTYDYSSYLGYFESIDVTEEATAPFRMIYTITFKSEKTELKSYRVF